MAFFPRVVDPNFTSLFRFLDDFESYSREVHGPNGGRQGRHQVRSFTPRFDVRETETSYELHGELPGIDRKDINIETRDQSLSIHGRTERNYSSGNAPAAAIEDARMSGAITEAGESNTHKASVSDEEDEAAREKGTTVAKAEKKDAAPAPQPKDRYWHQERSIGEFHRTFNFPSRIDETGVTAKLENGILNILVPKVAKKESRRIDIN